MYFDTINERYDYDEDACDDIIILLFAVMVYKLVQGKKCTCQVNYYLVCAYYSDSCRRTKTTIFKTLIIKVRAVQ